MIDFGDRPEVSFQPDQQHPKAQNLQLVADVARRVADQVECAVRDNVFPIVLGGDCSITLGVVAGLIDQAPNLGLMYFDGDLDLNTPDTTPSGIFDGMVIAHMTGKGVVITEFNAHRDKDGTLAQRFVDGVVRTLEHGHAHW